jgi:hypothetical protein
MLQEKEPAVNAGVGFGFVLSVLGLFMSGKDPATAILGRLLILGGLALFLFGCVNYAQAKGQSGALGLFGLLHGFGLIILYCLPDKYPNGRREDEVSDDDLPYDDAKDAPAEYPSRGKPEDEIILDL